MRPCLLKLFKNYNTSVLIVERKCCFWHISRKKSLVPWRLSKFALENKEAITPTTDYHIHAWIVYVLCPWSRHKLVVCANSWCSGFFFEYFQTQKKTRFTMLTRKSYDIRSIILTSFPRWFYGKIWGNTCSIVYVEGYWVSKISLNFGKFFTFFLNFIKYSKKDKHIGNHLDS